MKEIRHYFTGKKSPSSRAVVLKICEIGLLEGVA
jgi:hypothetical protein